MKLQILDELTAEVTLPLSEAAFAEGMEEFCLAGKVEELASGRLYVTIYPQKCTLDEATMSALFNEALYLFKYRLEFKQSADFDPEFCLSIRRDW